ncbi:MAG: CoA pyrophosphatase [Gammaproteobacteria bacterium]|nr:CoA pyrophosphatase [Gammaproteobacteria bacterium]
MNAQEFAARFSLLNLPDAAYTESSRFVPNDESKSAAVLVPIIEHGDQLNVLFTTRAKHLRHHPGQVSFPGGKYEDDDKDLITTAIRESHEEIGLNPKNVQPLGWLPSLHTISNFTVYPLVSLINNQSEYVINKDEVDDVFTAPLNYFLERQKHFTVHPTLNNVNHKVHFMPFQERLIWGATAAILDKLVLHFE